MPTYEDEDEENGAAPAPLMVQPSAGRLRGEQIARRGPFGEESLEQRSTMAIVMAERVRSEIQAMHLMALSRPRDVDEFRVRLLDHCRRLGFAKAARYRKPTGKRQDSNGRWVDNFIEGASIRFVETALACYANVVSDSAITFEDDEQIAVRVTVRDLESTVVYADEAVIRKRVERRQLRRNQIAIAQRTNSTGDIVYVVQATDDEVANQKAARQSKLLRNLGLRILPADVVDEAMDACKATLAAGVAKDPAGERKKITDAFHAIGISPIQLVEFLGHSLDQMQPAELVELREIYQSLRDGESTWQQTLAARLTEREGTEPADPEATPEPTTGVAGAKAKLKRNRQQPGQADPPAPAGSAAPPAAPAPADPVRALFARFERILETPDQLPALRAEVEALPDSPDRVTLLSSLARAERMAADSAKKKS